MTTPIANPDDYIPTGEYNPYDVHPFVINNEYGFLAIAYASNLQDALDIAADADLLKGLALDSETALERETEFPDSPDIMYLGNASEPYDSVYAGAHDLPNKSPDELTTLDEDALIALYR